MADKRMTDFLSYNIYLTRWKEKEVAKSRRSEYNLTWRRLFNPVFPPSGGSLPRSPRGGKRPDNRPQAEDALWEAQLGQRVHQYCIEAPEVRSLSACFRAPGGGWARDPKPPPMFV